MQICKFRSHLLLEITLVGFYSVHRLWRMNLCSYSYLCLPNPFLGHLKEMGQCYVGDLSRCRFFPCDPCHLHGVAFLQLGERGQVIELKVKISYKNHEKGNYWLRNLQQKWKKYHFSEKNWMSGIASSFMKQKRFHFYYKFHFS